MKRLAAAGTLVALLLGILYVSVASGAPTCTDDFTGASGGDWSVAANWTVQTGSHAGDHDVPGSSDVACWSAGTTVVVTTGQSVDSIQGGVLEIDGGTLDLENASDDSTVGDVTLEASGVLEGPSPLTIDGSFTWTGQGQLDADIVQSDGSGTCFTLNGNGQAYITGGSVQTTCQVSIDDPGTINTGGATVTTTSTIDFGSGVIVGQGDTTFTAAGVIGPGSGTYGFDGDALVLTSGSTTVADGETLEAGSVDVQNGQTVTVDSGGTFDSQNGGTGEIESGGVVTGAGTTEVDGGIFDVDSGGSLTSGMSVTGGSLVTESGSTTGSSTSPLSVTGGTFTADGATTTGNVTLSTGGVIDGSAQISIDGSFTWTGQAQLDADIVQSDGSGTCFTLNGNGQAYITGGSVQTTCQVTIDDPGTINTGGATVTTTSTIDFGSGIVVGQGDTTFTAAGVIGPGSGTYGFDGDALVLTSGSTTVADDETLEAATFDVQSGQTTTIDSGGTLDELGGGTGEIESGGVVTGAGTTEVDGGIFDVDSGGSLTSGMSVTGGSLVTESGSTTGSSSSPLSVTGGTFTADGATTTGNVTLATGGVIDGSAQISIDGSFTWTGQGELDADIDQTDGSGTCFTLNGNGQAYFTGGSVQTTCQVTIDDTGTINNALTFTTTSTLDFGSGVIVGQGDSTFTAAGVIGPGSGSYGFADDTLVLSGGSTTVADDETLESGAVTLQGGTLSVSAGGEVDGPVTLTGGTLDGLGLVDGGITNTSGTVEPGPAGTGTLSVDDGYAQGSAGTLEEPVSGTANGDFPNLNVESGDVSLDGTLEMDPTSGYAASAAPGDRIPFMEYSGTLTGDFASVTSTRPLQNSETFSDDTSTSGVIAAVVGTAQAPTNTKPPVISGTDTEGHTLTTTNGSWTNNPSSFTYQWQRCTSTGTDCQNVTDETSDGSTLTLGPSDVGHEITVAVTASNGTSSQAATATPVGPIQAPATAKSPVNTKPPAITGTPKSGSRLTCSQGSWSNAPTAFTYAWSADGTPIVGATSATYTVSSSDEGLTLTCIVTASNAAGKSAPSTSAGVKVPVPIVAHCPAATGKLSGTTVGRLRLGMTRAKARRVYKASSDHGLPYQDFFCLTPSGMRAGYLSPKLARTLTARERSKYRNRVIWIQTANAIYAIRGIRPGATLTTAEKALPGGNLIRVGLNQWYLAPAGPATAVLKVRQGIVLGVGIGERSLTKTLKQQKLFMSSFG